MSLWEAKMPKTSLLERIEFLSRELDLPTETVLSKAIEAGVFVLYRHCMADRYLAGKLTRDKALSLLGPQEVARLDCVISRACERVEDEIDLICGHA
jgi:hypothetical protein